MRIVGGRLRGLGLTAPAGADTRPTSDRLRESLFNILAHRYPDALADARVLDLFAGTGALGLEAFSRGARFVLFIETAAAARGAVRRNVEAAGATGASRIWRRDATRLGTVSGPPFTLCFADPPYGRGLGVAALASAAAGGWLVPGAIVVLEERADAAPEAVAGYRVLDRRTAGDSSLTLLRYDGPPDAATAPPAAGTP